MTANLRGQPASVALYRLLLFCYPPEFRHEYGDQMIQVFRHQYVERAGREGKAGVAALWLEVVLDHLTVAPRERFSMILQDLRFAIRTLLKSPAFSLVAIATIALGIGAATTMFSVVNGVILRPVPFREPDRLAMVYISAPERGIPRMHFSIADYIDWRNHDQAFEQAAAFGSWGSRMTLTGRGEPDQVPGVFATGSFFSILGTRPVAGRLFEAGDDKPGRTPTVVLSERLWERKYGSDPAVVGSTINVNGRAHTVVGIAPSAFRYPSRDTDAWAILPLDPPNRRGPYFLRGLGLLKPHLSAEQAEAQLAKVPIGIRTGADPKQKTVAFTVVPLQEQMVGEVRPMLLLLLGSVSCLLLIAVANVANLQVARAAARAREIATRLSLGASWWHITRQQLVESLVVGVTGGCVGVLLAVSGTALLRWLAPANLPRLDEIRVDTHVLLFALAVSLLSSVMFGLAPALRARRSNLKGALDEGGRQGMQSRERSRLRAGLAVAQIGLSCVLLVGAGLLIKSFAALQRVDIGIESSKLAAVSISPSGTRYQEDEATRSFYRTLIERVRAVPGIERASLSSTVPPGQGGFSENITVEGAPDVQSPIVLMPVVEPEYFRTMSIPLRAGRYFGAGDGAGSARVTIISQAMARRFFPGQNPVGKRIKVGGRERPNAPWLEIVGVVGDVRYRAREADIEPVFYIPHSQNTIRAMYLVVRGSLPPKALHAALRNEIRSLDGSVPVVEPRPMDELLYESIAQPRFRTLLIALFGVAALLIAAVGLYGVIAYGVVQRVQEIGIRIALGAQPGRVQGMVIREAAGIALAGIGVGLAAALMLQSAVTRFLFGVTPTDPVTFAVVVAVLALACLLASYLPARRASRVDPVVALKGL